MFWFEKIQKIVNIFWFPFVVDKTRREDETLIDCLNHFLTNQF